MSASFLLLCVLVPFSNSDWPQWRGPAGTGVSAEAEWSTEGAEEPLWEAEVGLGYSAVSVLDGRLFTIGFDPERKVDVTACLDAVTGREKWRHEHPAKLWDTMHEGGALTTPVVSDGRVFALSRMGALHVLDAADGKVQWEVDLIADHEIELGSFGLCTSPLVVDSTVFLNVGKTLALDAATGEVAWTTRDYGYSYSTPVLFEHEGESRLAVFNAVGLVILDAGSGAELAQHGWTSNYNVNCASPIVIEDRIFISTGYDDRGCAMLRFTGDGLELLWESKVMRNKMNGCVLVDRHLYGFDHARLVCIDLEGNEQWVERGLGLGTVVAGGARLIVLTEDGELVVGPASDEGFEEASRKRVLEGGKCWTTPVLSDGLIYCRNQTGALVCLDHR